MTRIKVKICGIAHRNDVTRLDQLGVDFAGIWWGVPDGKYDQPDISVHELLHVKTDKLKLILVTLEHNLEKIKRVVERAKVYAIQLHGFQLPFAVKMLKNTFQDQVKIIKVLHINNDKCMEEPMLDRFVEAGVDYFLLDHFSSQLAIGSTGQSIHPGTLEKFLNKLNTPVFVAGGINDRNIGNLLKYQNVCAVDIDSYVKDENGDIQYPNVEKIMESVNANNYSNFISY